MMYNTNGFCDPDLKPVPRRNGKPYPIIDSVCTEYGALVSLGRPDLTAPIRMRNMIALLGAPLQLC
jgi:hypothetical protein